MQPSKHADILLECAHELYSKEKLCDVVLCAEGKSLSAHRVVLVAYSSYFAANSEITGAHNKENENPLHATTRNPHKGWTLQNCLIKL